jgi:hypothetical protein
VKGNKMHQEIREFVKKMREAGHAVCIFTPEELNKATVEEVEDAMCMAGWEFIENTVGLPNFMRSYSNE